MNSEKARLLKKLESKKYRDAFVDSAMGEVIASQIYNLRKMRGWSGKKLGQKAGMAQPRVPLLENADYKSYTLSTLRRLANAFDVALIVRFAPFEELVDYTLRFSSKNVEIPEFPDQMKATKNQELESMMLKSIGEYHRQPPRQEAKRLDEESRSQNATYSDYVRNKPTILGAGTPNLLFARI